MKREDVGQVLALSEAIAGIDPTACAPTPAWLLAALCRRWLAVEDAAPVCWLAQKRGTDEFEFANPHEKATNPKHWTDAFPVYRAMEGEDG